MVRRPEFLGGPKLGMDGYFTLPYAYVTATDLASDFWTIRVVT